MALSYTEIEVEDETFHIFTLPDRRPTADSSQPVKWLYQMIVESYLYHDGDARKRGVRAPSTGCSSAHARGSGAFALCLYARPASARA